MFVVYFSVDQGVVCVVNGNEIDPGGRGGLGKCYSTFNAALKAARKLANLARLKIAVNVSGVI